MLMEKILGVWELHSWETEVDDRVVGYPSGEQASGFLTYHPMGFMSVNISAPNRVRLPGDDPFEGDPKLVALGVHTRSVQNLSHSTDFSGKAPTPLRSP